MRIFIAVRHALNPKQFYGGLWSGNFYPALRSMGHELVESQVDLEPASRFMDVPDGFTPQELEARARITDQIIAELTKTHAQRPVDLFLSYFYNAHFDPSGFERIRALGVPSINFYCNSIHQFANVAQIAPAADIAWHAERDARASYLKIGARPIWVQMGADPTVYHPIDVPKQPHACFVGQSYADRADWLGALIHAGVPVEIYGHGWSVRESSPDAGNGSAEADYLGRSRPSPGSFGAYSQMTRDVVARAGLIKAAGLLARRLTQRRHQERQRALCALHAHGPATFEQLLDVFGRSAVCLNFSNVWLDGPGSALVPHVRLRDFEAPMCRTCYLTGHTDEITAFYEVGREIDTYRSTEELVDKTRFYLSNPDAAERLREAGYRRALADHTWVNRFTELFSKANLPNA